MFELAPGQLIEMVGPTVSSFRHTDLRIALCATPATISSEIYQNAFRMIGIDVSTVSVPGLAGAIERGMSDGEKETLISTAFEGFDMTAFEVLILACTHYPLAITSFRNVLGNIQMFDPAHAVAARVEKQLWPREAGNGSTRFLISAESPHFRHTVNEYFPGATHAVEVVSSVLQ